MLGVHETTNHADPNGYVPENGRWHKPGKGGKQVVTRGEAREGAGGFEPVLKDSSSTGESYTEMVSVA
jgi:hypothetical protein